MEGRFSLQNLPCQGRKYFLPSKSPFEKWKGDSPFEISLPKGEKIFSGEKEISQVGWNNQFIVMIRESLTGIHGPEGPGTDRSESVRDFQNFVGPGLVWDLEIFIGRGPVPDFENFLY